MSSKNSIARGGKQVQISKHFSWQSIIRLKTCTFWLLQILTMYKFHEHAEEDTESEGRGHEAKMSQGMYVQKTHLQSDCFVSKIWRP